jgi:hypothetical protein
VIEMSKIARIVLNNAKPVDAQLVRLSKAAQTQVKPKSTVLLWVPATVASAPNKGPKPTRNYGRYQVGFTFDSLVGYDTANADGVSNAFLACVLFHQQGVQVVQYDLPQVVEAVLEFCDTKSKKFDDRLNFVVRRTRGQKEFKLHIGTQVLTPKVVSGWIKYSDISV